MVKVDRSVVMGSLIVYAMPTDALVSIIIPTYYRNQSLERAIESARIQEYEHTEIIVVDDSGEQHAKEVCDEHDVEYVAHEQNKGGNPSRNTGISHATGEYIQLLDDDDKIHPNKIAVQVALLEKSPNAEVVYGGIIDRSGNSRYPSEERTGQSLRSALELNWVTAMTSSLLITSDQLLNVCPLKSRPAADDIGMRIELSKRTNFRFVDQILTDIGDTDGSRSSSMDFILSCREIIVEYDSLYDKLPASVRRNALGYVYRMEGHTILFENYWSLSSTKSFCMSIYYYNRVDVQLIIATFLSVLGLPGMELGRSTLAFIKSL